MGHKTVGTLTVLLATLAAAASRAQEAAAGTEAATEATAEAEGPTEAERERASARFEQGMVLLGDENWAGALVAFEEAYELLPHHAVLFNIGVCRKMLHEYPAAVAAFEAYLREGGERISAARRAEAESLLAETRQLIATVTVQVDVDGAEILVDGEARGTSPLAEPLLLGAGEHRIAARGPDGETTESRLRLAGGSDHTVELTLGTTAAVAPPPPPPPDDVEPPPESDKLDALWFWITGGTAVALGIGAGVTGYLTYDTHEDFAAGGQTDADLRDRGETLEITTNALVGVAAAAAAAAVVLAIFTDFGGGESAPADEDASSVTAAVVPGGFALAW